MKDMIFQVRTKDGSVPEYPLNWEVDAHLNWDEMVARKNSEEQLIELGQQRYYKAVLIPPDKAREEILMADRRREQYRLGKEREQKLKDLTIACDALGIPVPEVP